MEIVEYVRESITGFIELYKIELLSLLGIILVIIWIVKEQFKIDKVMNSE